MFDSGLVSPQSQALVAPTIMETINGFAAIPEYGLSECLWWHGLGDYRESLVVQDQDGSGFISCSDAADPEKPDVPFRLRWTPRVWETMDFPDPNALSRPDFSVYTAPYCGCADCDQEMWDTLSGGNLAHTCGGRIRWTHEQPDLPSGEDACYDISHENSWSWQCGPKCDPTRCDMDLDSYRDFASAVINEMDILLTGGRLEETSKAVIVDAYVKAAARRDVSIQIAHTMGLRVAQQLFSVTPEFQITNNYYDEAAASSPVERDVAIEELPEDPEPVSGYKAIVYLFFGGGADSYSLVVPMDGCTPADLPGQYYTTRGDVAIDANLLHPIQDSSNSQPCSTFGLHPSLGGIQSLYNNEEAAVIAGIGPLVQPTTKNDYDNDQNLPPALFAHNTQTDVTQTVLPQDSTAHGVLGRIGDAINEQESLLLGERTEIFDAYSISG